MAATLRSCAVLSTRSTSFRFCVSLSVVGWPVVFCDSIRVTAISFVSGLTFSGWRRGLYSTSSFFRINVCARNATANWCESRNSRSSGRSHAQRIWLGNWISSKRLRVSVLERSRVPSVVRQEIERLSDTTLSITARTFLFCVTIPLVPSFLSSASEAPLQRIDGLARDHSVDASLASSGNHVL